MALRAVTKTKAPPPPLPVFLVNVPLNLRLAIVFYLVAIFALSTCILVSCGNGRAAYCCSCSL